jgi:hypothetical protein
LAIVAAKHKKACILLRDGSRRSGYVDPGSLADTDPVAWLDLNGQLVHSAQDTIHQIWLIRDFGDPLPVHRKIFGSRPRQPGLWVQYEDWQGESSEALLANDLLPAARHGFLLTPPGGGLRLYLPRVALQKISVLGVIGARSGRSRPAPADQIRLFEDPRPDIL